MRWKKGEKYLLCGVDFQAPFINQLQSDNGPHVRTSISSADLRVFLPMKNNHLLFEIRSITKAVASIVLVGAVAITAGCSVFQPTMQNITVSTTTPGATIKANGVTKGQSPVTFAAKRDQDLNLIAVKPGYQDSVLQIPRQISGTFMLDAIGGCIWLVPWIGLLTPGAYQLSDTQVELPLNKSR